MRTFLTFLNLKYYRFYQEFIIIIFKNYGIIEEGVQIKV